MRVDIYSKFGYADLRKDETVRFVQEAGFDGVFVAAEASRDSRRLLTVKQAEELAGLYEDVGVTLRGVFWPAKVFNRGYVDWVGEIQGAFGWWMRPVLDCEHQWIRGTDDEDQDLRHEFRNARITTHSGHDLVNGNVKEDNLSRLAHELEVQALSVAERNNKGVPRSSQLGPGKMQRMAAERGRRVWGKTPFITLPCYGQDGFEGDPGDAMEDALRACITEECPGVAYWSLQQAVTIGYAREFFLRRLEGLVGKRGSR